MSSEQRAFLALFNSFELSQPISSFEELADSTALFEVMNIIDPAHFKQHATTPRRDFSSNDSVSGSSVTWITRMNVL